MKKLAKKYEATKCLPLGGDKKKKRCYLLEKIAVVAFNLYSNKSDGLEHTEGGKKFLGTYEGLMAKEKANPELYSPTKLEENFADTVAVLDSVETKPRARDMLAISNVLNNSPVPDVQFTTTLLSSFLQATTCPGTPESPWVYEWNLIKKGKNGDNGEGNSGCMKNIRRMRSAVALWHSSQTLTLVRIPNP